MVAMYWHSLIKVDMELTPDITIMLASLVIGYTPILPPLHLSLSKKQN